MFLGGAEGTRTPDPHTASVVLSQLSYGPMSVRIRSALGAPIRRTRSEQKQYRRICRAASMRFRDYFADCIMERIW